MKGLRMQEKKEELIEELEELKNILEKMPMPERLGALGAVPAVNQFLPNHPILSEKLAARTILEQVSALSIIAIGQGERIFGDRENYPQEDLDALLCALASIEQFYDFLGGVIGYHLCLLKMLSGMPAKENLHVDVAYVKPEGKDLSHQTASVNYYIRRAIDSLDKRGEIYPVGGAGDRMGLLDETTQSPQPVAFLTFNGSTLLDGLMRDLQAKEYLYYKLHGSQTITPIAMMTSSEKDNHRSIRNLCLKRHWFYRPADSFTFCEQPLVPVLTEEGDWVIKSPLKLMLKPGGHGVIWKLAKDCGIFDWFYRQGKQSVLVRQINNPVSGVDHTLLSFVGVGVEGNKSFGFASCPRVVNAAEGMNVCAEKRENEHLAVCITNVEYTDFKIKGLQDIPEQGHGPYSSYPANTNILYAHLPAIEKALLSCQLPGQIINMKTTILVKGDEGAEKEITVGRLESTMQNIADAIVDLFPLSAAPIDQSLLHTYITYNLRRKTLAVTKSLYDGKGELLGTPEGALLEKHYNDRELLEDWCHFVLPEHSFWEQGRTRHPSFWFRYHPALGPLFQTIGQKMHEGKIHERSEIELEIADFSARELEVKGALYIQAECVVGIIEKDVLYYSNEHTGKCELYRVRIENAGVDEASGEPFWKGRFGYKERCMITLEGNGEFIAENVILRGNLHIRVKNGHRVRAYMKNGELAFDEHPLSAPSWSYRYTYGDDDAVLVSRLQH